MDLGLKIILTIILAGLAVASVFIDPSDPGPQRLYFGNKRLFETVTDGTHLKKTTKLVTVIIAFLFFGAFILIMWFGG